jgi:hypothetical protein
MTQALYAHRNNKRKKKKERALEACPPWGCQVTSVWGNSIRFLRSLSFSGRNNSYAQFLLIKLKLSPLTSKHQGAFCSCGEEHPHSGSSRPSPQPRRGNQLLNSGKGTGTCPNGCEFPISPKCLSLRGKEWCPWVCSRRRARVNPLPDPVGSLEGQISNGSH